MGAGVGGSNVAIAAVLGRTDGAGAIGGADVVVSIRGTDGLASIRGADCLASIRRNDAGRTGGTCRGGGERGG